MELALLNLMPVTARVPNIRGLNALSDRMVNELIDALAATAMALTTFSLEDRQALLNLISLHLENVDTCVRTLFEWSAMRGQTGNVVPGAQPGKEPEEAYPTIRIISKRQFARYLASMHEIRRQLRAWEKRTTELAEQQKSQS